MFDMFLNLFLQFIIYSFIGYLIEVVSVSIRNKKLTLNRGFFLGPYLPIFGFSCILMGFFILNYKKDLFTVFVMSAFISTTVEYITSYVLEKIFKARWWDYSNHKFNIEGRVCLGNSLFFGIGGIVFVYLINPIVTSIIKTMSLIIFRIVAITSLVIFLIDVIITVTTLYQVKVSSIKFKNRDVTAELTKIIRQELNRRKEIKSNFFIRHMLNAFPEIKITDNNPLSKLKKLTIKGINKKRKSKRKD